MESYLNSKPDSLYLNPYWVESEQHQYKPYDLVANTWWSVSQYAWLSHCKINILSVSKFADTFVIRTMFYNSPPKDSGKVSVIIIFQTGARLENGSYKLCNVLPINTRFWKKEQVGSIKYIFPPDHQFNRVLAERMNRFIDSLAAAWQTPVAPVEYYFADDLDRVAKALGFDYYAAEGNIRGPGGYTDVANRIIYAGGSDEWYPHEFVHIYINPLFPNAHHYFLEGYATLVGGSSGHDLSWHLRRNYEYLHVHPEVNVLTFKGVDLHVYAQYFIGGLLCKMAEEQGGIPMIRKLMTYGKEDEDLYRAIQDIFGIDKEHVNDFLRKKLAEYATK
ncbi:MAG: hypothetical protein HY033_12075 [Ignavibacteriae bacterium]|nr:hypothetical protein [Ignavibacteria bacterium]MBI3365630.1 hypothetical protein [Ignavibacteriota bacterium]